MSARRAVLYALLVACLFAVLGACRAFPGHPVRLSEPRLAAGARAAASDVPELADIADIADDEAAASLFRGLEGVYGPLRDLCRMPLPAGRAPRLLRLARMESAVRRRYRRGGFGGPVRAVTVLGVIGRVPLDPSAMADLIGDPRVERAVLGADALWLLQTVYDLPAARRSRFRARLLNRGMGPLRYDLRFTFAHERRATRDGRVFLRYDPDARPRPEHVTLFRGGCLLEPEAGGTRVTEILILGTDLQLLPPLQGEVLRLVRKTLRDRAINLWIRAWRGR